ncbi:MAG: invasion protein IalB [Alteromonas macleodii]|jgi:invasion protein IalB
MEKFMISFTVFNSRTLLAATLACGFGAPFFAQEAANETSAATNEEQTQNIFNMGEKINENSDSVASNEMEPQGPQPGQQYLQEVFSDWALRCLKVEDGDDPCQMYQLLSDAEGNAIAEIAIVSLSSSGEAVAGATIVAPLETSLSEQITLRVDGGQARRFPFDFCNAGGCVTRVGLTETDMALFQRGATATLSMVPAAAPDQIVTVTMSLSGFTAAYNATTQ